MPEWVWCVAMLVLMAGSGALILVCCKRILCLDVRLAEAARKAESQSQAWLGVVRDLGLELRNGDVWLGESRMVDTPSRLAGDLRALGVEDKNEPAVGFNDPLRVHGEAQDYP